MVVETVDNFVNNLDVSALGQDEIKLFIEFESFCFILNVVFNYFLSPHKLPDFKLGIFLYYLDYGHYPELPQ